MVAEVIEAVQGSAESCAAVQIDERPLRARLAHEEFVGFGQFTDSGAELLMLLLHLGRRRQGSEVGFEAAEGGSGCSDELRLEIAEHTGADAFLGCLETAEEGEEVGLEGSEMVGVC